MIRLQRFFSDDWTIQRHDLESAVSLLMPSIVKGNISAADQQLSTPTITATAIAVSDRKSTYTLNSNIPEESVAMLYLTGMLYSWTSEALIEYIREAESNPNICGVVLVIDGPGGMISHLDQAASAVANCSKPTATVVTGVMASAHFWLGTSADMTFIASPLCEVGSVGVVITHYSFRDFFKNMGIDYREIYPDSADLKNEATRALEESNDESLLKEKAARLHKAFSDAVSANLGIEYDPEDPLFRGRMFSASEAVNAGYIDKFGGIDDAVTYVLATATAQKASNLYSK